MEVVCHDATLGAGRKGKNACHAIVTQREGGSPDRGLGHVDRVLVAGTETDPSLVPCLLTPAFAAIANGTTLWRQPESARKSALSASRMR